MPTSDVPQDVLGRLVSERVASRVIARDGSLWPSPSSGGDPPEATLGWLDLPARLTDLANELREFAEEVRVQGFTDAVLCGMGGSSMTSEVLRTAFGRRADWLNLYVLDTVHPETVSRVTNSLDLKKTIFLISSKSGTTIEPLTLESHFREAMKPYDVVERHFVALSDAGSPMAKRAQAGEFRKWFDTPVDVGGRFSALSAFGMLPAALMGIDIGGFERRVMPASRLLRQDDMTNPGLELGAFLGGHAVAGRDKVTALTSPSLARFGLWIEQLLAESTGKNGKGLVPVAGEPLMDISDYGDDRQFVYVRAPGAGSEHLDGMVAALERAGRPLHRMEIYDVADLGSTFLIWEFATAVAGHIIGVYPFDQPDVELAKQKARDILSGKGGTSPETATGLSAAIRSLIDSPEPGAYVAIAGFLDESEELTGAFRRLRAAITRRTGMATTFGYGPRYQHSIGQLYKGGPANVRMLVLKSHGTVDLPVPGTSYTLTTLIGALADGDTEAMHDRGRRVEAVVMVDNPVAEISAAVDYLVQKH